MNPDSRPRWLDYFTMNAWFLGLGFMWNSLHRLVLPAVLPLLVGIGLQASALGALTTVGLLVAIVVQPISGAVSDRSLSRFGRRRPYMLLGSVACAAVLVLLAYTPNFLFLFLLYCLLQVASNVAHGPAQGLIPDLVPEAHHGAASGVKVFLENFTLIMAGLITGTVLLSLDSDIMESARIAMFVMAGLLLVFLAVTMVTTRETPLTKEGMPLEPLRRSVIDSLSIVGNVADIWRNNRPYSWLLIVRLVFLAGIQIVANFGQFYFKDIVLAGDPNAAARAPQLMGQLLVIIAIMLVLVSVPAGVLSDRFGRRTVSAVGAIIVLVASLFLLFIRNSPLFQIGGLSVTDLTVTSVFIGAGAGAFFSVNWAWATDLATHDQAGRYLGISNLATAGAGILANIGGPIIDWGNSQSLGLGYTLVFFLGASWLLFGILLLPRVPETRGLGAVGARTAQVPVDSH